jgi:hypothetical protein
MSPGPDSSYVELRARAREQLNSGRLPARLVESVSAGYGSSVKACSLCGESITPAQVEYEVIGHVNQSLTLHLTCYVAWRDECLQRMLETGKTSQPANPPPAPDGGVPERP